MSSSNFPDTRFEEMEARYSVSQEFGKTMDLRVLSGLHEGASTPLYESSWLILGSGKHCDVVLIDDGIADQHCLIGYQAGRVTVRGLDGIVLARGRALESHETITPSEYEVLQIGKVGLAFGLANSPNWAKTFAEAEKYLVTEIHSTNTADIIDHGLQLNDMHPADDRSAPMLDVTGKTSFKRSFFDRRAQLAMRLFAVLFLTLGGVAGSWHGASQANNTAQSKAGVMKIITDMGFTELVLSKGSGGLDLLTGVIPTEASRADLVNVLAKKGFRPASDIVTGEHLAMAVQNEFRQRGWNVTTNYLIGGTVLVDGLAMSPEVKALESQILRGIKGVKQLAFVKDGANSVNDSPPMASSLVVAAPTKNKPVVDGKSDGKRITGVVSGDDGYLITADGSRYAPGAMMQDGTEIERISEGSVTFIRKGKSITVDF
jgi:type III secretion system YscD/HrpQ family protein